MKIIRRVDDLGRIVLPKEVRRMLRISEMGGTLVELSVKDEKVILRKYDGRETIRNRLEELENALHEEEFMGTEKEKLHRAEEHIKSLKQILGKESVPYVSK